MEQKIQITAVIASIRKEWSTVHHVDENENPLVRDGVPTSMLPHGSKVGDKIILYCVTSSTLERIEKR